MPGDDGQVRPRDDSAIEAADRRRISRLLRYECLDLWTEYLRAGSNNDPVRLRIGTIAGVTSGIDEVRALCIIQNRRPAVVAAIRVVALKWN